jgi:thiol-disulfide isomerase/thioredoxin
MKNGIIITLLLVIGGLFYVNNVSNQDMQDATERLFGDKTAVVSTEVTNKSVDEFLPKVVRAFDSAEDKFLKQDIKPIDDGTNPDAAKCICKGTGQIRQGDGHVTVCPYHGNKQEPVVEVVEKPAITLDMILEAIDKKIDEKLDVKLPKVETPTPVIETPKEEVSKDMVDPHPNPMIPVEEVKKAPVLEAHIATRKARPQNAIDGKVPYQVLIFTASWCGPCKAMLGEITEPLRSMGLEVSESTSADVRVIDVDVKRSFFDSVRREFTGVPLILEVIDNKIVDRHSGYLSLEQFLNRYDVEE